MTVTAQSSPSAMDLLTGKLGRLTDQVSNLVPRAEERANEPRIGRCEEALDRLAAVMSNLCEYLGVPIEDFEPLPTRQDLMDDPVIEDWGTNTYYPRYVQRGVGTSDDGVYRRMDSSARNPGPHFEGDAQIPSQAVGDSEVPIPGPDIPQPCLEPVENPVESDSGPVPISVEREPPSAIQSVVEGPAPIPTLDVPDSSLDLRQPSVEDDSGPVPIVTDTEPPSALRPVTRRSLSPRPERLTPLDTLPTPRAPSLAPAESDPCPAEPEVPARPLTPQVNLIRPTPENSQEHLLPPVVALEPNHPEVGSINKVPPPDSTSDVPTQPPSSPRKRTRSPHPPIASLSALDSLAVPDWQGIQTRASSRARSVSPGIPTRASSRARSVSPGLGDKRKSSEGSDDKVAKRRKD